MNRDQFLSERASGLGGTDIAAILGVSPWRTPLQVWEEKTRRSTGPAENVAMRRGRMLEPFVAEMYRQETGRIVRAGSTVRGDEGWMLGHLDGESDAPDVEDPRVLEIKTVSPWAVKEWGEPGTDEIPLVYVAQAQWYMGLSGHNLADVAALIGVDDLRIHTVHFDAELFAAMVEAGRRFWHECVLADVPPAPLAREASRVFKKDDGSQVSAMPKIEEACTRLAELKAERKALDNAIEPIEDLIKLFIGEAAVLNSASGSVLATWKSDKPSQVTDWKALAEFMLLEYSPDMRTKHVSAYTTTKPGTRRFLLKA